MKPEIEKVNKRKRSYLLLGYLASLVIFIIVIIFIVPYFKNIYDHSTLYDIIKLSDLLHLSLFILISIPAVYLIRTGIKIIKQKRYPYKGMILMQDMKVLKDQQAIKMGKRLILLGSITILFLIISIISTRNINNNFLKDPFGAMKYRLPKGLMKFFPTPNNVKNNESNKK